MKNLVLFLHIPKTGGTSYREILAGAYGERLALAYAGELRLAQPDRAFIDRVLQSDCAAICGHFAYGVHRFFPERDCKYVAFLRDPVERCVSHFRHVAREPRSRHYKLIQAGMTLRDLQEAHRAPEQNNHYTRLLADSGFRVDLWPPNPDQEIGRLDQLLERSHLDRAIAHIRRDFLFVGLTDQFARDVKTAFDALGVHYGGPLEVQANVSQNAAPVIDEPTLATIAKYNALDMELHSIALANRDLFDRFGG